MLADIYTTTTPSFIKPRNERVLLNLDGACHSYLARQAQEAWLYYHSNFAVCSGRGTSAVKEELEDLIDETRALILSKLDLTNDFEVVFTNNATEALNMAYSLVGNYVEQTCEESWEIAVHPLAHKSLLAPAQKLAIEYDVKWRQLKIKRSNLNNNLELPSTFYDKNGNVTCDLVYGLPYVDNVYGINHWSSYIYETLPNIRFQKMPYKKRHLILDATQALPYLFSNDSRSEDNVYFNDKTCFAKAPLDSASAIAFSAHKFHCPHLGVLLIRKEYLKNQDFFKLNNITSGGGNLAFVNGTFKSENGFKGLEAGLKDDAAIIAFGAFLDHLCKNPFYKIKDLNKVGRSLKKIVRDVSNNYIFPADIPQAFANVYPYSSNNILPLLTHKLFDTSMISAFFAERKIETRAGKFCADFFFNEYQKEEMLRLSYDYSFLINLEKNLKEFEENLGSIILELGEMHFAQKGNPTSFSIE